MIRLERRPQMSKTMMYLSPVFALGLTLLAGIARHLQEWLDHDL